MKELFLRPLFAGKKLNVINKQGINRAVKPFELINRIHL